MIIINLDEDVALVNMGELKMLIVNPDLLVVNCNQQINDSYTNFILMASDRRVYTDYLFIGELVYLTN